MSSEPGAASTVLPPLSDNYLSMVLLVDDQVLICEAVRRALLGESDIDFHYCTAPLEAVRTAEEIKPTVILQDLVMPGIDGLELVRQYRATQATHAVPVIVLSTKDEPSTKSDAFRAGANDYLVKLPDRVELIARIRYHSRAYLDHVQRDAAYTALRESQRQLLNANLELQRLTRIDGLTSLGNRRYFDEYMQAEWRRAQRTRATMSLLMIDVDNFKRYNDAYGHLAGDEVLKQVAGVIRDWRRPRWRSGGPLRRRSSSSSCSTRHLKRQAQLPERLVQQVRDLAIPHGAGLVTISAGVASAVPSDATSPDDAINAADIALFRA